MAKKKDENELDHTPALSLNSVAYALVQKGENYQFVTFNFDVESKTMSEIEVVYTGHKFEAGDELALAFEDELYKS